MRRVAFYDVERERRLVFLSNNFDLPPLVIAQLDRCRWQVDLFFKWIKQHLRINTFYGHNSNAVKTPVWTAISTCVLVAIVKQELHLDRPLSEILQILSRSLVEKTTLPAERHHGHASPKGAKTQKAAEEWDCYTSHVHK